MHGVRTSGARWAFTLVEILVVVGVIALATVLIIPAFGRLIESTNYSSAVNQVTAALGQARAIAIRENRDTGVAFLYDARTEVFTLVVLERLGDGSLTERPTCGYFAGTAFRPATNTTPVELPPGTGVFGLAAGNQIAPAPPGCFRVDGDTAAWYAGFRFTDPDTPGVTITPWLFPRNDPRLYTDVAAGTDTLVRDALGENPWIEGGTLTDNQRVDAVRQAQSFFVQFSPEGSLVPFASSDPDDAYLEFPEAPLDPEILSNEPQDEATLFDPEASIRDELRPNPEVLLRQVDQLAVVDLRALAADTGVERPWLIVPESAAVYTEVVGLPDWIEDREDGSGNLLLLNDDRTKRIGLWIDRNGEVLGFNRYTGNVVRRGQP